MQKVFQTSEGMKVVNTTINKDGHLVVTYEPKMTAREFVESCFDGCQIKHDKDNNRVIFFIGDDLYFELKKYNNEWVLWCSYSRVWSILLDQYRMKYDDIKALIQDVVKDTYNMGSVTPINVNIHPTKR